MLAYPSSDDDDEDDEYDEEVDEDAGLEEEEGLGDEPVSLKKPKRGAKKTEEFSEDEDIEGWGDSKQDYYGGDVIDTEQAALDEEAEAKRLQQKQLGAMADVDLYLDEGDAASSGGVDDEDDHVVTEVLPDLEIPETLTPEERLKLLKSRYPEFEPIAKDWLELHGLHEGAAREAKLARQLLERKKELGVLGGAESHIAIVRYTALSAYLGACAMYFAILTSTANGTSPTLALAPRKLRDHPVIKNILETRQMWQDVEDYFVPDVSAELAALEIEVTAKAATAVAEGNAISTKKTKDGRPKKIKKSQAEREAEAVEAASAARRAERMRKVEKGLADLSSLTSKPSNRSSKAKIASSGKLIINNDEDSDFGEETELTAQDLAAKAQRKKSLKFYTSQIAQKTNRRGNAGRDTGGDMDIPHRERLKDRAARLNAEAEKRGKKALRPGEELDGADSDGGGNVTGSGGREPQDEDYYDMIAARSKQKKADSKAAAEAYGQAKKDGAMVHEVTEIGPDGKRKISYQIEKNKGLTPHRKKEVRSKFFFRFQTLCLSWC